MNPLRMTFCCLLLVLLAVAGCDRGSEPTHDPPAVQTTEQEEDPHAGHDHAADQATEPEQELDPHAGHDHGADQTTEPEQGPDPHAGHDHGPDQDDADAHAEDDHETDDEDDHEVASQALDDDRDDAHTDDHDDHDHEQESHTDHDDQDAGHAEDDHDHGDSEPDIESDLDDHSGHDHEAETELGYVELTPEERSHIDLELATAGSGTIDYGVAFPGEIVANEDRVVHIVPRAVGIVREVGVTLGDYVEAGQILAWIDSAELAQAKLDFYAARAEVGCCQIELPRAKEIFESTHKMLALLEADPSVEKLQELDAAEMGEFRGSLVTAYAEYQATKKVFDRERDLFAKNIASENDFISAESAFKKAQAAFTAAKDLARFQSLVQYTEAAQKQQVAEFKAVSSEQNLRLLGVEPEVIEHLVSLVPQAASIEPCLCDDPNCTDGEIPSVLEVLGTEDRLSWHAIRAPISGYVAEKHLTTGEKIGTEDSVLMIVDTSSVWVRFGVYQKDMALVRPGQLAHIESGLGFPRTQGVIKYVAPFIDPTTRTAQARLQLSNPDGNLRPGLFVDVHVDTDGSASTVVIEKDAVQLLEEQDVVFIPEGDEFVAIPVTLGASDRKYVSVLSGLEPGDTYVRHGAFELKAKIVTSGLDAHAGHGH